MPLALKEHRPINVRSPFFIDCIPAAGTIVSAVLTVTIQLGDRRSGITSMTDVKTYTLSKTDAIDGIIVFEIAALVRDYFEHKFLTWTVATDINANAGQIYFLKVTKVITNNFDVESPVTNYYTINDGYVTFKEGVNYLPSTGATGNYDFPTPVAYGTNVTIMATDCYRQMGQNSYALLGFFLGEFQRINSDLPSFSRVKFGHGEDWKTSLSATTNVVDESFPAVSSSPTEYTTVQAALKYSPLGYVNMLGDWISGHDYLRVGHFVKASDIGGTGSASIEEVVLGSSISYDGLGGVTITVPLPPEATQTTVFIEMSDCGAFTESSATFDVVSITGNDITVSSIEPSDIAHLECISNAGAANYISIFYDFALGFDAIASINAQPILRYEILCEPKYSVIDCVFINKWGCWDSFSFVKKSMTKFNTTSSNYKRSIGFVDRGPLGASTPTYSYSLTDHQKVQYNKNGIKTITVNTGFVDESFNLLLEEMMLSEKMYLIIDDVVEPVVLNTQSVDVKTSVNDKLINYTLEFEFAYNQLQAAI